MPACKSLKSMSKAEFEGFINSFDVVLSDCDGVLWRETETIERSPATVVKIKSLGKRFFYITNNNCKTRPELVQKCRSHDYDATEEEILCSSYLTAVYLKQLNFKKTAYVVGSEGIGKELEAQGICHIGIGPDVIEDDEEELTMVTNFKPSRRIGAVIVGFDKHFSFPKLVKAATYAHDPEVLFLCTNPDVEKPSPNSNRFPETGCFLRAIEAIADRKALILGKPESFVSEVIAKKYGVDPARTLMIGDNPETDILLGKRCGFTTLLVLSGITSAEQLENLRKDPECQMLPDYYADRMSDILDCLQTSRS